MPLILPPGAVIEPVQDTLFCQMYAQTGRWKKDSPLYIPKTAREEVFFARVVSVGPGRIIDVDTENQPIHKPHVAKAGDSILFARYHGERIQIEDELYIILRQDDVLAKITLPEGHDDFLRTAKIGDVDDGAMDAAKVPA